MEKILLGVSGVGAKVVGGKLLQLPGAGFPIGKIELLQGLENPNIDGKGGLKTVTKEEYTIRNFWPDSRERYQLLAGFMHRHVIERLQVERSIC
jgi:hypothetical protein